MSSWSVKLSCNAEDSETLAVLLQEMGFTGIWYIEDGLIAYSNTKPSQDEIVSVLAPIRVTIEEISEVEDTNWNETWENQFTSARINESIAVRAPFQPHTNTTYDIIINPEMAFGTGHHPTTRLSAIALQKLAVQGKKVLDMGCGSGILAILAEKMGAPKVLAIDYDLQCVENTNYNLQLNKCKNVVVERAADLTQVTDKFDIIISNIVKNINLQLLPQLFDALNDNGHLILCGFLHTDLQEQQLRAEELNLQYIEKNIEDNWLQTTYRKTNNA